MNKSNLTALVLTLMCLIAFLGFYIYSYNHKVPKNVIEEKVKHNPWRCTPSPPLQQISDEMGMNMDILICGKDREDE